MRGHSPRPGGRTANCLHRIARAAPGMIVGSTTSPTKSQQLGFVIQSLRHALSLEIVQPDTL